MNFRSLPNTAARGTRLALETLEGRTLLSADGLTTGFQPSVELDNSTVYEFRQDTPVVSPGDANRDGVFDQRDLVQVLMAGKYVTAESANWAEGDWNGDDVFDQLDLVAALQAGNYSNIARAGVSALNSDNWVAAINGEGVVTMTATGDAFDVVHKDATYADNQFRIKAKINADGSASGIAFFDFGEEFSNLWDAERATLKAKIQHGEVQNGAVVLRGTSYQKDFAPGVFFRETTDFTMTIDPSGSFSIQWCMLPAFQTDGHVTVVK